MRIIHRGETIYDMNDGCGTPCHACSQFEITALSHGKNGRDVAKLSRSPEQTFVFNSCFSARALMSAPLVMTLLVFMDFMAFIAFIGAMFARRRFEWMPA